MDADLNKSYIPDLSSPSISSPKQMQVFTLRQEFGKSADSLDYKYRKGEKCGRDKESERMSAREMLSGCGCVHMSICVYLIFRCYEDSITFKQREHYVAYEHHVSVFLVYMGNVY